MDSQMERLAQGLRLAEQAHAAHELKGQKDQWPEFYAQWLIDNVHLWSPHVCADGSCAVHSDD